MSIDRVDPFDLIRLQAGRCASCKKEMQPTSESRWDVNVDIDNDGHTLGIICSTCKRAADYIRHNIDVHRHITDYIMRTKNRSWDEYFIDLARVVATRSKDPSSQVGAVIVRNRNILSTGYNGFPRGVNDNVSSRYERPEKYKWVIHGEENAILNASRNGTAVNGATLYVTPFSPCTECAKAIVQSGIRDVVVDSRFDNPRWAQEITDANSILRASRVEVRSAR